MNQYENEIIEKQEAVSKFKINKEEIEERKVRALESIADCLNVFRVYGMNIK